MSASFGEFTIDGRSYPLILPTDMNLGEQQELKRLSGGMRPMEALRGLQELDPDAFKGVLIVSMRRVAPATKDDAVDDVETMPLLTGLAKALQPDAEPDADPPTTAAGGGEEAPASS